MLTFFIQRIFNVIHILFLNAKRNIELFPNGTINVICILFLNKFRNGELFPNGDFQCNVNFNVEQVMITFLNGIQCTFNFLFVLLPNSDSWVHMWNLSLRFLNCLEYFFNHHLSFFLLLLCFLLWLFLFLSYILKILQNRLIFHFLSTKRTSAVSLRHHEM